MAHTHLYLTHNIPTLQRGKTGKALLRQAINKAMGCVSGAERDTAFTLVGSSTEPAAACTFVIIGADPSGAVGAVINGVTLTATWTTSATVSAGLVATAIRASTDALIQYNLSATNIRGQMTFVSVAAGTTITVGGFRFTAIAGTTESNVTGEFVIGGTDTADATSFCRALNQHPAASRWFFAANVAGVIHVFPKSAAYWTAATAGGPTFPENRINASAAAVTVNTAIMVAGDRCGVWALRPGKWGNCMTIAASGGNVTIENTNTRFTRGLGGDAAPVSSTL